MDMGVNNMPGHFLKSLNPKKTNLIEAGPPDLRSGKLDNQNAKQPLIEKLAKF